MDVAWEMYLVLFNRITDAHRKLQEAMKILEDAQIQAEEIYISQDE